MQPQNGRASTFLGPWKRKITHPEERRGRPPNDPGGPFSGKALKMWRIYKDLTAAELGARVGLSKKAVLDYETGARFPTRETLGKLAKALGCKVRDLAAPPKLR